MSNKFKKAQYDAKRYQGIVGRVVARAFKHGQTDSREYSSWKAMKQRCQNPNNLKYMTYGGRGIKVCDRWNEFFNFFTDMGKKPSPDMTLDRIDSNGNYEPSNCRWASRETQQANKAPHMALRNFSDNAIASEYIKRHGNPNVWSVC